VALTSDNQILWQLVLREPVENGGTELEPQLPPPPPPVGVIGIFHFDIGTVPIEEIPISQLVNDPAVIADVQAVEAATTTEARIGAIDQLMERIG
jgi:hypothetical protein